MLSFFVFKQKTAYEMLRSLVGKQKTAYEMLRSLVGSEMCIRDRSTPGRGTLVVLNHRSMLDFPVGAVACRRWGMWPCALSRADFFDRRLAGRALRLLGAIPVSYTHLRAHETPEHLVCRLLLEKKKNK